MLRNYLKITFRNLIKFKTYSFINICGLAIGMICFIFITLFIVDELSYDKFHKKAGRIYRITMISEKGGVTRTPHPMAQALVSDFPEVETAVTMSPIWGPGLTWAEIPVKYGDKRFIEKKLFSADTNFFDVFTFKTIAGDADKAIREVGSIIITQSIAKKYFGNENPIGKTLIIYDSYDALVKAVIEDIPQNSHFHFDFLVSYLTLKPMETSNYYTWADFGHYNYIVLREGVGPKSVEDKIPEWSKKYIDYSIPDLKSDVDISKIFKLQALIDIHLHSDLRWELETNGNIAYIYIFSTSAILILFIACFNFMNLSTARFMQRTKEVGVRKSIGAKRKEIITQFLSESLCVSLLSMIFALCIIGVLRPIFNGIAGKILDINMLNDWRYLSGFFVLALSAGIFAGIYPAFYLSSFSPIVALRDKVRYGLSPSIVRKTLVIFQFSISLFLIICTLIIQKQLNFFKEKNPGFNKEQVLILPLYSHIIREKYLSFKNSLLSNTQVLYVTTTSNIPGSQFNIESIRWKADRNPVSTAEMWIGDDFFKTLGIEILQGRSLSKEYGMDTTNFMLNETAAKRFDWDSPIGKEIRWYPQDREIKGTVVGLIKDFNFQSLHQNIRPLLIHYWNGSLSQMLIRIKGNNILETIESIEKTWIEFKTGDEFEYSFLDGYFDKAYRKEENMEKLFEIFSIMSLLIASMGLYGLALYMIDQRTKEIGVRKTLGATFLNIFILLSKDLCIWILIANIIAWPIVYLLMENWLNNFAYHIDIDMFVFLIGGMIVLIISFLTISYQAIKAALANPVDSLRYE